jgi:hypothetical protein
MDRSREGIDFVQRLGWSIVAGEFVSADNGGTAPHRDRGSFVPHLEDMGSIKIVGLGGTGGLAARHLVLFLAALAEPVRLVLVDGDEFEPKNAARMFFSSYGNKAEVVRDDLLDVIGDAPVTLSSVGEYVTPENIGQLLRSGDVVFLCVDNHATRKLVAEHCAALDDVCLISGGNDGVGEDSLGRVLPGTYGNVQIHLRRSGRDLTPQLWAYHPEIANPPDKLPTDESCTEAMASVPQLLFANLFVAAAMLNAFYVNLCRELDYAEVCFDIRDARMRPLDLPVPAATPT